MPRTTQNWYVITILALVLSRHYRQVSALSTRNLKGAPLEESTGSITLSLWLLPPKSTNIKLKRQMEQLSENGTLGPLFPPHITLIGGISCRSETHVMEVVKILEDGLAGFGKIPCTMSPVPYESKGAWNQALYLTVELSAPFLNICQKSRALLGMDTENWTFPAPATYPHLSLFYGVNNVPDKSGIASVAPFHAYTLAIWRTDPPTLDGVDQWREISAFDIR